MRPPQNNKRMRGRPNGGNNNNSNRRGPNPLTRSYESNGSDTKVRGTAAHIAEKYVQLARDAHVAGDPVAAENHLQHAEHYFRLIAAAQAALNPPQRNIDGTLVDANSALEVDDEDFDGGINDRFTYRSPQSYQAPAPGQPLAAESSGSEGQNGETDSEQPSLDQPYNERTDSRNVEPRYQSRNDGRGENRNANRFEGRRDRNERPPRGEFGRNQDGRGQDGRSLEPRSEPRAYSEPRSYDSAPQEGNRFETPRRERPFRQDRNADRSFEPRNAEPRNFEPRNNESRSFEPRAERPMRNFQPEIANVQPILPSFITAPVRPVVVEVSNEDQAPFNPVVVDEKPAPKVRRRRVVKSEAVAVDAALPSDTSAE